MMAMEAPRFTRLVVEPKMSFKTVAVANTDTRECGAAKRNCPHLAADSQRRADAGESADDHGRLAAVKQQRDEDERIVDSDVDVDLGMRIAMREPITAVISVSSRK